MFVKYAYFQYLCIWNMKMNRNHILQLVTEGEHVHQDFKFAITDACKIAAQSFCLFKHRGRAAARGR